MGLIRLLSKRLAPLFILNLAFLLFFALKFAPQISLIAYKIMLVSLAAWGGYWLDRWLFPYARPHLYAEAIDGDQRLTFTKLGGHLFIAATARRAILIAAVVLAVALGA